MVPSTPRPGLILHTTNRLEILAEHLAEVLDEPLASPLTAEIVVVPGNPLRRWLTQQLAEARGICANIRFLFPQNFWRELFALAFPEITRSEIFEPEAMAWRIFQLLPRLSAQPAFAPVANYLARDQRELRAYELARRIASAFDRYLVFRPEMILRWDAGEENDWQPLLWRELTRAVPGQNPAALAVKLIAALKRKAPSPERVSVFGTLPPSYLLLLQELATRCPVHLFALQPTPEWWCDLQTRREKARSKLDPDLFDFAAEKNAAENSLLLESGKVTRDYLNLLVDLAPSAHREDFAAPAGETKLRQIQRDIFALRAAGSAGAKIAENRSLQIHSCHSITRELEVLHDQLLALFESDPGLKPRDIIVMLSDVAAYAPFIDGVFGVPENLAQKIPYTIADRTARARSGVIDTFLRILEILPGRFGASEVFAILESPAVQRRFNLLDLPLLQRWTQASGIRWGIDAAHRGRLGLPAVAENTWRWGFDRMLLGSALPPDPRELVLGIFPFDEIEGSNAELLGNFVDCLEALFACAADFAQPRSLQEWQRVLINALDQFLEPGEPRQIELTQLRTGLAQMEKIAAVSENDDPVSLEIAKLQLEYSLGESHTGFLGGALTFSALTSAVPAKVLCLLGLNDNAFPGRDNSAEFDLIAQTRRCGDRNRRDDDRARFLEALLCARDVFYVSYLGQSMRDNKDQPPSVLVNELIDYIAQRFGGDAKDIPVKHSLQAFSSKNFGIEDSRRFSYSKENAVAGKIAAGARKEPKPFVDAPLQKFPDGWYEIALSDLVEFFDNPSKFFLRQRLDLPRDRDEVDDREPFEIHSLARWQIEQDLLDGALGGRDLDAGLAIARGQGVLPVGGAGEVRFEELRQNATTFADALRPRLAMLAPPQEIRAEIGKFVVTGRLDCIRGDALVRFRLAKFKTKDFVRIWIEHLLGNLKTPRSSFLFGKEKDAITSYRFDPLDDALSRLENLLVYFERGLQAPLPLFPRTSWAFAETIVSPPKKPPANPPWLKEWDGKDDEEGRGEKREPHIALAFRNVPEPLGDQWEKCAREVYLPILRARR